MQYQFIDKITEIEKGVMIKGVKSISLEEYFLKRPMGERASFPVTLMVEALFQLGNYLIYETSEKKQLGLLTMFEKIELYRQVGAGDLLNLEVKIENTIDETVLLNGSIYSNGQKVLSGEGCLAALIPIEKLYNPEKFAIMFSSLKSS